MRIVLVATAVAVLTTAGAVLAQTPLSSTPAAVSPALPALVPHEADHSAFPSSGGCEGGQPSMWGGVEYLLWWIKDGPLPPSLVLTGDPRTANPGALNAGGQVVPGVKSVDFGALSGVRAWAGCALDSDGTLGFEACGFILPRQDKTLRFASDANGNPVLGFRYFDTPGSATPLAEDVFQASIPPGNPFGLGPFAGSLAIISRTQLWGTEGNAVLRLVNDDNLRLEVLGGFRYLDLKESLSLQLQSMALDGGVVNFLGAAFPAPSAITTIDNFRTRNNFYAGQVGLRGEYLMGNFLIGASGKVALGTNHEVVDVQGTSILTTPGAAPVSVPVGQFAGPSNIGRSSHDQFAVLPEVEVKVGYQVADCLRVWVGYDFLYLSQVVRPGSQVDLIVNDSFNPVNPAFGVAPLDHTAFPRPFFNRTDFWAQGLTFGVELRY
jgi:hypothetical protein